MKIAFVGFRHGHIYSLYDMAMKTPNIEITACVEENAEARSQAEEKLGIRFSDASYEEILTGDADIIAVGAAYGDRGAITIRALQNDKHVLTDKPLCTRLSELEEIERLTKAGKGKIGCMLDLRYLATSRKAKEILTSGRLGTIKNVSFSGQHCISYGSRPSWYFEDGKHGGTINDLAIHGIDLLSYIAGLDILSVDGLRTWNAYATRHPNFKDSAVFMARLTGDAELLADVSYSAPSQVFTMPTYWNFKFWCEKGMLTFCLVEDKVYVYEQGGEKCRVEDGIPTDDTCLSDLVKEIEENTYVFTNSVIAATRSALTLQQLADKE